MEKIKWQMFFVSVLLFFSACGGDNAYNGENLRSVTNTNEQATLTSIKENIFVKNSEALLSSANNMTSKLNSFSQDLTTSDVESLQALFTELIKAWKKVEAIYVAPDYDSNLRTMPIGIDFFNLGKNLDVATNINSVLNLAGALDASTLKNSSKTLTGLEYMIFGNQDTIVQMRTLINKNSRKRIDAMKAAMSKISSNIVLIRNFYKNDLVFKTVLEDDLNILVNTLIQTTFNLRELRIGEAAGFINKTKDDPLASRLEYYRSKKSLEAIQAILEAHQEIMGLQSFENFGSFAATKGADASVVKIRENIINALNIVNDFASPIQDFIAPANVDAKVKRLYDEITDLQKNYRESLISSLNLTADVIEADGD